jgi:hypothetical protein
MKRIIKNFLVYFALFDKMEIFRIQKKVNKMEQWSDSGTVVVGFFTLY